MSLAKMTVHTNHLTTEGKKLSRSLPIFRVVELVLIVLIGAATFRRQMIIKQNQIASRVGSTLFFQEAASAIILGLKGMPKKLTSPWICSASHCIVLRSALIASSIFF